MAMSLGRSFEERPKLEAQFFRNFSCCGLDLQDLHGLLEHFEECHVAFEEESGTEGGMEVEMEMDEGGSEGTISGPPSPRLHAGGPPRSVYELKKSALSTFETGSTPSSPATAAQQMEGGMEMDMEMEMDDEAPPFQLTPPHQSSLNSNTNSASSSSSNLNTTSPFHAPPMSAFDNPLPSLHSGIHNKKKFSTAMNPLGGSSMRSLGGMGGMGGMMGLEALAAARAASAYSTPDSSIPGTPVMEEIPGGGVDGLFSVPPGAINTVGVGIGIVILNGSGSQGGSTSSGSASGTGSLAPGLLFPVTPADSPPEDLGSDMEEMSRSDREEESGGSSSGRADGEDGSTTPNGGKAYHNLGKGVQMSPSGRPYTPPCEKPFKCSVNGCDKSYKQQNGLKYHRLVCFFDHYKNYSILRISNLFCYSFFIRVLFIDLLFCDFCLRLHGNCNQNNVGKEGYSSRGEGKPYICHVATCGKRYKKYVFHSLSASLIFTNSRLFLSV